MNDDDDDDGNVKGGAGAWRRRAQLASDENIIQYHIPFIRAVVSRHKKETFLPGHSAHCMYALILAESCIKLKDKTRKSLYQRQHSRQHYNT